MSVEYDQYLREHRLNVAKGWNWMKTHIPGLVGPFLDEIDEGRFFDAHDKSKDESSFEYNAYDAYFYGEEKTSKVKSDFKYAWLQHIHQNPHHWQYWVLHNDDPNESMNVLPMPIPCIFEMICDWWSFSWKNNDLMMIFQWYEEHKNHIMFAETTRYFVGLVLEEMRKVLESGGS